MLLSTAKRGAGYEGGKSQWHGREGRNGDLPTPLLLVRQGRCCMLQFVALHACADEEVPWDGYT